MQLSVPSSSLSAALLWAFKSSAAQSKHNNIEKNVLAVYEHAIVRDYCFSFKALILVRANGS